MSTIQKKQNNGVVIVQTNNSFALVTTKEILGPFNIKKESGQYSINTTNDHITQEELISIQSDLIFGEGGSING